MMEAFLVSLTSVTLGELGDRTQLLALLLATQLRRPLAVIGGIFVATLLNHLLAALVGQVAGSLLTPRLLRWVLGLSFLALAAWVFVPEDEGEALPPASHSGAFALTVTTFFLAEMGDKTQIVTMALGARYHSLLPVVSGTVLGMLAIDVPTVLLAGSVTRHLPLRLIRLVAALVYAVLGVCTLLGITEVFHGGSP